MRRSLRASLPSTSLPGSLYAPRRTVGQTNFATLGRGPSVGQMAARRAGKQPETGAGLLPEEGERQRGETEIPRETEDRDRTRGDKTGGRRGQRGAEERKGREQRDRERERPREGERRREGGERDRGRQTDAETERQRGRPREGRRQRGAHRAGLGDGGRRTPEPLSPRALRVSTSPLLERF